MKNTIILLALSLSTMANVFAQNTILKPNKVATEVKSEKYISSSILLWMRTDKARKAGMDRWKGPHAQIIAANKGLYEYRQIHLSEQNSGLWSPINGVETVIPTARKIDGIADVTLKNLFSIFRGKKQNKLAYADEINLFKRTILYAAFPKNSKWYKVSEANSTTDARAIVFFRIKEGVSKSDFNDFIMNELTPTLANTGVLKELRSKVYNPWKQKQWNTPNVLHDNATELQFQASLMLGFVDKTAMKTFFEGEEINKLSSRLALFCSAIHAYQIEETITFVKEGQKIK